jgi:protein TonB
LVAPTSPLPPAPAPIDKVVEEPIEAKENLAPTPPRTPIARANSAAPSTRTAAAPAQAGKTLTAPGDDGPADFTLVQGEGTYAGGITARDGSSTQAVHGAVGPSSEIAETAASHDAPHAPAVDRSRPASPQGGSFSCSHLFPTGFDIPDEAAVRIVVRVRADGSAERVSVLNDPGHGFGAAAISCAMSQRYQPALDSQGLNTASNTPPFVIRFRR